MDAGAVKQSAKTLLFNVIADVSQSLAYGVFLLFFPVCMYLLSRKRTRTSIAMMGLISFMFALSTLLWVARLESDIEIMLDLLNGTSKARNQARLMSNVLALFNFVVSDGVVVWRAWALGKEHKVALRVCTAFLGLTSLTTVLVIVVRIITLTPLNRPFMTDLINTTQTTNLAVSLITNLIATSIISLKAWRHRREFNSVLQIHRRTKAEKILLLLIESGAVYCASGIFVIISTVIRLPHGTLGDIYQPVHAQLSGLYPTAVLVLVHQAKSLDENMFTTKAPATHGVSASRTPGRHVSVTLQFAHADSLTSRFSASMSTPSTQTGLRGSFDLQEEDIEKSLPPLPEHDSADDPTSMWDAFLDILEEPAGCGAPH